MCILWISLLPIYRRMVMFMLFIKFFMNNEWHFDRDNINDVISRWALACDIKIHIFYTFNFLQNDSIRSQILPGGQWKHGLPRIRPEIRNRPSNVYGQRANGQSGTGPTKIHETKDCPLLSTGGLLLTGRRFLLFGVETNRCGRICEEFCELIDGVYNTTDYVYFSIVSLITYL